jgi:hypothetical protein
VRNEEVLHRVKVERNILHTIKSRKANSMGHILPFKTRYLKKTEGMREMEGRRGRRSKQLLDDLKEQKRILEIERGTTRSHSVGKPLRKRLWTCCTTDCYIELYILHIFSANQITLYLGSVTLLTAVVGTVRPLQCYACSRNIHSVGRRSTWSIFIATLVYPADNVSLCYEFLR